MFYPIRAVLPWLALLLSSTSLFLSSWIVIPAPTMSVLPLGVGAPELSPWLVILNVIAVGVSWFGRHESWLQRGTLGASLLGLLLSVLPLVQLPATEQQMSGVMRDTLGANYEQ